MAFNFMLRSVLCVVSLVFFGAAVISIHIAIRGMRTGEIELDQTSDVVSRSKNPLQYRIKIMICFLVALFFALPGLALFVFCFAPRWIAALIRGAP
jgi:hypothetical protein